MITMEDSPTLAEEVVPHPKREMYGESLTQWRVLAQSHAEDLEATGHDDLIIVIDSSWEYAIGCGSCGLWLNRSRRLFHVRESCDSIGGALQEVVGCSTDEIHKRFGHLVTPTDPWDNATTWNFTEWIFAPREDEPIRPKSMRTGTGGWRGEWRNKDEPATKKR
jgi:hypothetical protein